MVLVYVLLQLVPSTERPFAANATYLPFAVLVRVLDDAVCSRVAAEAKETLTALKEGEERSD